MNPTSPRTRRQGGRVEGARVEHAYAQIPLCLLTLPTGERAAAIEVWATLHQFLRLGTSAQRITDDVIMASPFMVGRSVEHARKGLEILGRLGLIDRQAKGSSRQVAVTARLAGARPAKRPPAPTVRKLRIVEPPDTPPTPEEIALMKRYFPKRCGDLIVPGDQQS